MDKRIVVLPGDGIGQEIIDSAIQVLNKISEKYKLNFQFSYYDIGGTSYEKYGVPLTDETVEACLQSDAILMGAIGGEKWDALPTHLRPEQGLQIGRASCRERGGSK